MTPGTIQDAGEYLFCKLKGHSSNMCARYLTSLWNVKQDLNMTC